MERRDLLATIHRRFAMSEAELTNGFAEHTPISTQWAP